MGMIEVEIVGIAKKILLEPVKVEAFICKLALIVERQAIALKAVEWHKDTIDRAKVLDQQLFQEIQKMHQDLNPHPENDQITKTP